MTAMGRLLPVADHLSSLAANVSSAAVHDARKWSTENADGSEVDDAVLTKARKDCLQEMDAIRLQMSRCSDASACARIQVAPEDFARLLPKMGASTRTTVPRGQRVMDR
jgi:hypothetical protein